MIIDLIRYRAFTTLARVREDMAQQERLSQAPPVIYAATATKFWTHTRDALRHLARIPIEPGARQEFRRVGPRLEEISEISDWRGFLSAAEANPALFGPFGLSAFMAAHAENCRHPIENIAWSAREWISYNHAVRRAFGVRSAA